MTKIKPLNFYYGLKCHEHDQEGRVVTLEYDNYFLVSVYVPNSGEGLKRLDYRVNLWDKHFFLYLNKLKKKKNVIVTGDLNVVHKEIDIYNPIGKEKQPGFTIAERNSFQNLIDCGFVDTYRYFHPNKQEFTFWANRAKSRIGNKGWRLDYFLVSNDNQFSSKIKDSQILSEYLGSDHCPIKLTLN